MSTGNMNAQVVDSVEMGANYADDVYYSMSSGEVGTQPNNNWHIAFSTSAFSSTIIINDGAGVVLYTYPDGDTGAWDTVSTEGIDNWTPQYNSPDTAMIGAFDRNALGHPDYGWGIYNSTSHDVVGDSLFVIQLPDQSYRKLWIDKKLSVDNKYVIQYANIDGSEDIRDTLDINPYVSKNFAYFSFETGELADREPDDPWDILFTRYYDERIPYPVTGVVSNIGVEAARITEADTSSSCFGTPEYSDKRTVIGSDWKSFNMETYQYELEDSLVFVVRDTSGMEYSLYFTRFEGSSTGKAVFVKRQIDCTTGTSAIETVDRIQAYPNPADNDLFIRHYLDTREAVFVRIYDLTGRMVRERTMEPKSTLHIDISDLKTGLYILQLKNPEVQAGMRISIR